MTSRCLRTGPVYAKVKGTEDETANGLVKLKEEDKSFTYGNDPETKELIIASIGDMQLSVLMAKLQSKYKVEAVQARPRSRTARRSRRRSRFTAVTRSSPAVTASSATFMSASSRSPSPKR